MTHTESPSFSDGHSAESDEIDTLAESIAEHAVLWGEDDEGNDVPMGFDVAKLRSLLAARLARAWDEGMIAGHAEMRLVYEHDDDSEGGTPNPYLTSSPAVQTPERPGEATD